MVCRTEVTLEGLLSEPMIAALMRRDGISVGEARALYDSVTPQLKERAERAKSRDGDLRAPASWTSCCAGHISPPM
jgi:hypothetical protein